MAPKTQAELANRIKSAKPADPDGRYDWASKVEVRAYFKQEVAALEGINDANTDAVAALQARVAELEMSWWAKLKRFFKGSTPPRTVGKPREFAAPYGEGATIKQGEMPQLSGETLDRVMEAAAKQIGSKGPSGIV